MIQEDHYFSSSKNLVPIKKEKKSVEMEKNVEVKKENMKGHKHFTIALLFSLSRNSTHYYHS